MLIVYASRKNKTEELVKSLGLEKNLKIENGEETVNEPFVLVTYSDKVGEVPEHVAKFLTKNHEQLKAVIATGCFQRHYKTFCYGGMKIAMEYEVPLLATVNERGSKADETKIKEILKELEEYLNK